MIWEFNPDLRITVDSDPDVCSGFATLSASVILPVVLEPSASKTISTVLHLHNTSATRKLSVYLDGQRIRHECHPTNLGVTRPYAVPQRTLDKDCTQAEEPEQLVDQASQFHLGRQQARTICGHLLWRIAIQQQSTAPQSGHALLTQVRSMCS